MNDFLDDMLLANLAFLNEMIKAKQDTDITNAREKFRKSIQDLRSELEGVPRFYSDKVFVPNRKAPPLPEDDLDVEELFSNAEWPELDENIVSKNYEVEKITDPAGVRG